MSWRNYHEYLNGTLWWLEGIATLIAFIVPIAVLLSGAQTSTAKPLVFAGVFAVTFSLRLWGAKRLMRKQIHWPTAFALRILRVPVGVACLWWLLSRKVLAFEVTPKGASDDRQRGAAPRILWALSGLLTAVLAYAAAGSAGWVPWRTGTASSVAAGVWLLLAAVALVLGTRRIRAAEYASSRRNAHRVPVMTKVRIDGVEGELLDLSVGGAAVRFPAGTLPNHTLVTFQLPGATPIEMIMARVPQQTPSFELASLQAIGGDWGAYKTISLWLFHTPAGALPHLPPNVPAIATVSAAA
jgi:cellulose synthase (UDP-forming)